MPAIYGYGEDGLTHWAFRDCLADMLQRLHDDTPLQDTILFFRPSFGRAGGIASSQFGEFDAILGTRKAVYLVESKWRGIWAGGAIMLESRQVLRHRIFRWLRERWMPQRPANWAAFVAAATHDFQVAYAGKPLAPPGSRLADNLHFVLHTLRDSPAAMIDVLAYFHLTGHPVPGHVVQEGNLPMNLEFVIVPIEYAPVNPGAFILVEG
jgi:hypothetical protein